MQMEWYNINKTAYSKQRHGRLSGTVEMADGLEQGVTIGFAQESKCGKNGPQLLTEMSVTAFFIASCKMKCTVARCVRIAHNITVQQS